MRKTMIVIATLVVSLGGVQLIESGGAGAASPKTPTATSLRFTEGLCSDARAHCKTIGNRNDPFAFGNRLVFSIPLSAGGRRIGFEQGECVYLQRAIQSDFCTYDLHLAGGTVSLQGTLPTTSVKAEPISVTGGTRAYLGAFGTLTLIPGTFDYRLHVLTP